METMELNPNQIVTLNDYPIYSNSVLSEYLTRCKFGKNLPFVPVLRKTVVRNYFDDKLIKEFEDFERRNPVVEYFMLDGSHRTTALALAGCKITVIIYERDEDIREARKSVATGQILENGTLNHTLDENCEILGQHFRKRPYFQTVEEKTRRMAMESVLPRSIVTDNKLK